MEDTGRISGVIDWGDTHLGDPALDLSIAFTFLPADARATFEGAYGDIDHETQCRARFRGIYYGVLLVSYGGDVGDQAITEAGRWALRHSLA